MIYAIPDEVLEQLPRRIADIHSVRLDLREPFIETARRFALLPGTVSLMSGGTSDCARYHILGLEPWLTIRGSASAVSVEYGARSMSVKAMPLDFVQQVLRRYSVLPLVEPLPIAAGMMGYLSYDLKDCLEELPRTSVDDLQLPHLHFVAPSILVIEDRVKQSTSLHLTVLEGDTTDIHRRIEKFQRTLTRPPPRPTEAAVRGNGFASGFSRQHYLSAVGAIRDYIANGDVYQVNMSQRFESTFEGDGFALFSSLYAQNPAPFFAYVNAGDHQIISTSPERFISLNGRNVETRPIKGTRPRGQTVAEDHRMRKELESSLKDDAELSMIVDLLRNDIGKVCRADSVHVCEHKRLESYTNVHHLVSIVRGALDSEWDAVDLIRATFPGGSVTGCPKIRAMEIIDELEPVRRHIYTGSIGYISFHETMDLSIAIRTATVAGSRLLFSVGGGVVYDSIPAEEYEETLHKGRTLMSTFGVSAAEEPDQPRVAWHNGQFKSLEDVAISVEDEGFLYGHGIFETIRVQRGIPWKLDDHMERFNRTWRYCFDSPVPDVTWGEVVRQVVAGCHLTNETAAVKILAAAGRPGRCGPGETLLVTARKYVPRLAVTTNGGLQLAVYPHRRHSHLSDHKTMNYMFCKLAATWAKAQLADEAIILNFDHSVSETNTANIFCVIGDQICRPHSEHVLPGIMERAVCALFSSWGKSVESRKLSVQDLQNSTQVFVTNSLMGAVPVSRIDQRQFTESGDLCRRINQSLLD